MKSTQHCLWHFSEQPMINVRNYYLSKGIIKVMTDNKFAEVINIYC